MQIITYKVCIKADDQNRITAVNSSAFLSDFDGWTLVDEGVGDRYHHAQGNYFGKPIYTMDGIPRYKLVNGVPMERTATEVEADRKNRPTVPSENETLRAENKLLAAQVTALTSQNDFKEELIVELAEIAYA